MKVRKTFSLDEEVVQMIRLFAATMNQTESAFLSMLVRQVDQVAAEVVMQVAKSRGDAGQESE